MYILAIETTGAYASVAISDGKKILANVQGNDRFSHLQNLMPQVDQVLKKCELSLDDMTAIAVSVGPGSFTGIRIGVSSARALSQILGVPCVPVSSIEALALRVVSNEAESIEDTSVSLEGAIICPLLDARRSQVYAGAYTIKDGNIKSEIEAGPYDLEELLDKIEAFENVIFIGDGIDSYGEKIKERRPGAYFAKEEIRYQHADTVAYYGGKLYEDGKAVSYDKLQPDYMRIPEAERNLKEKQAANV